MRCSHKGRSGGAAQEGEFCVGWWWCRVSELLQERMQEITKRNVGELSANSTKDRRVGGVQSSFLA